MFYLHSDIEFYLHSDMGPAEFEPNTDSIDLMQFEFPLALLWTQHARMGPSPRQGMRAIIFSFFALATAARRHNDTETAPQSDITTGKEE